MNTKNVVKCWSFSIGLSIIYAIIAGSIQLNPILAFVLAFIVGLYLMRWALNRWDIYDI